MLRLSRSARVGVPARVAPRARPRRPCVPRSASVDVSKLSADALPDELAAPLPWDAAFAAFFLRHYWQRRPLLIRQAVPGFQSPLSADELAGLACEVPSRIVLEQGGVRPWELVRRGAGSAAACRARSPGAGLTPACFPLAHSAAAPSTTPPSSRFQIRTGRCW